MKHIVKIADMKILTEKEGILVTYGLGSCISVILYDRINKVAAMIHYMLPVAGERRTEIDFNPFQYGDSGLGKMLDSYQKCGGLVENTDAFMVGGAKIHDNESFGIGKRNVILGRKFFQRFGLSVKSERVEGYLSRNLYLNVEDGSVWVKEQGAQIVL